MKEIKDKKAIAKALNQDLHIKGGGIMNLQNLTDKIEKIVDKDPSDDVEPFPYEYVKLPDFEYTTEEITQDSNFIKVGHIDIPEVDNDSRVLERMPSGVFRLVSTSYISNPPVSKQAFVLDLKSNGPSSLAYILDIEGNQYVKASITGSYHIPAGTYVAKDLILFP